MRETRIYVPEDRDDLRDGLLRGFWTHREAARSSMTFTISDEGIHTDQGDAGKNQDAPRAARIPRRIDY